MGTDTIKTRQTRRIKIRKWLAKEKDVPCADCKQRFPTCVMQFDHLPQFNKRSTVSKMVLWGYGMKTIKEEVAKCEIVCANCHLIRTHLTRPFPCPKNKTGVKPT